MDKQNDLHAVQNGQKKKNLRILICQNNPTLKNSKESIEKVKQQIQKYDSTNQIDLVMFPQMSFVGYNFESEADAQQYGHFQMEGEEFEFIISLAKRLQSYVGFGYIEKLITQNGQIVLYNSLAVIDRKGDLFSNYRKSHLYHNDKVWAKQGNGFITFQLFNKKGELFKCVPAICADISQKNYVSGKYELGDFMLKSQAQVLLQFTNWVEDDNDNVQQSDIKMMHDYWLSRMKPLTEQLSHKKRLLVFCDRVGAQDCVIFKKKVQFYGGSCAFMLNPTFMIDKLGILEENFIIINAELPNLVEDII